MLLSLRILGVCKLSISLSQELTNILTYELAQKHSILILIANLFSKLNHKLIYHTHMKLNTIMISLPIKELNL